MTVAHEPRESPAFTAARREFELALEQAQREGGPEAAQQVLDAWHRSQRRRSAMTSPTVAPDVSREKVKPNGKAPAIAPAADPNVRESLERIPVSQVDVADNVRTDPHEIDEMAASIIEHGVISPIKVVGPHSDGSYRLVYGQRRLLGARQANQVLIPAIVVPVGADVDDPGAQRSIEQLVENLQRNDLNPIDEAKALRAVLDADPQLTQHQLAVKLGRSDPWVSNALRVLETAPEVQQMLTEGKLTAGHVRALAGLDVDLQAGLAQRAAANGWSTHDVERNVKWEKDNAATTRKQRAASEKRAKEAIAMLEKVANRESATIGAADYMSGNGVAKLLREDGWNVESNGWSVQAIDNAGSCGCQGVWRLEVPYQASTPVKLSPGCNSDEHKEQRRKAKDAQWAEKRKADEVARQKAQAESRQAAELVAAHIAAELDTPFVRRLILFGLIEYVDVELFDAVDDSSDEDDQWTLIAGVSDDRLPELLARAVASAVADTWRVGDDLRAAIAAQWPKPAAEKPAKKKAAA
jgi:ParB family transcriptional regulator, chromosome partitioning protein